MGRWTVRVALASLLVVVAAPGARPAPLGITGEAQRDLMVTVYNGNRGLVKDVREVHLPAGTLEVQFRDVAALIDPTTVHLKSLTDPARLRILEQNYESYGVPVSHQKVGVYLELKNSREHHLGVPLPRGTIRVYKADGSGSQQFIGEDWIDHTPRDERVRIKLGHAFDVVGERTPRDFRKIAAHTWEVEWEVVLRNHKAAPQTVTVIEPVPGDWQVLTSTHPFEKLEAHTLRYRLDVPKDGATRLVYRVRIRG